MTDVTSHRDDSGSEKENISNSSAASSPIARSPPPKPTKPANFRLSTCNESLKRGVGIQRKEATRVSVRKLQTAKRVSALRERYDPQDNFQRWKSDENLCIFHDRRPSSVKRQFKVPSRVAEESTDDENEVEPLSNNHGNIYKESSVDSHKTKDLQCTSAAGINVRDRIRAFESCATQRRPDSFTLQSRQTKHSDNTYNHRHTVCIDLENLSTDTVYEQVGSFKPAAAVATKSHRGLQQCSSSPRTFPTPAFTNNYSPTENVYDVGGYFVKNDDTAGGAVQESEYASTEIIQLHKNSTFMTQRPSIISNMSDATSTVSFENLLMQQDPVDYMLMEIKSRISDAFAVYRKISAVAAPMLEDDEYEDDDDGSKSNMSGELAERVHKAECIHNQTAGTLLRSVEAHRCHHDRLFAGCAIIQLHSDGIETDQIFVYPPTFSQKEFAQSLPHFCFPDAASIARKPRDRIVRYIRECDQFSFVITDHTGERLYGYCRRMVPGTNDTFSSKSSGDYENWRTPCIAEACCIISSVESEQLFNQILLETEEKRSRSLFEAQDFLAAVYSRSLPDAGAFFELQTTDVSGKLVSKRFERPTHWRMQHVPYSSLFTFPGSQISIYLFSALLHEHKVALVSSNPQRLSSVAQALAGLLYPLRWQHTFVPIVPPNMLYIIASPTPFIIGILEEDWHTVQQEFIHDLDNDVTIVHLDRGEYLRRRVDEKALLSRKLNRALRRSLDSYRVLVHRSPRFHSTMSPKEIMETVVIETGLRFFAAVIGHYRNHIEQEVTLGARRHFNRDTFCLAPRSKGLRNLLRVLTETGNFHIFMNDVLEGHAYQANKLTVSTVLSNFDRAVSEFKDDCEENNQRGILEGFKVKMKKIFHVGKPDLANSRGHSHTVSTSTLTGTYPNRATLKFDNSIQVSQS